MPKPQREQSPGTSGLSRADAFGLIYMFVSGHAATFFVFTRKDFGTQAFGMAGPVAMLLMFLYAAFAPCPEMITFGAVWLALVIVHRLVTLIKRWRGWETHSLDDGISWLVEAVIRPRPNDLIAKAVCEPVLAIITGALLCYVSEKLGLFVVASSVSLTAKRMIEHGIMEAKYRAMRDHEFELRAQMDRYRGRS